MRREFEETLHEGSAPTAAVGVVGLRRLREGGYRIIARGGTIYRYCWTLYGELRAHPDDCIYAWPMAA